MEKITMEAEGHKNELPQRMLTVKEVASILNIHTNTVRRWEEKGLLESYGIGPRHSLRFKQEDILDFLDKLKNEVHAALS
jgi:excisionase family DNA binding protein